MTLFTRCIFFTLLCGLLNACAGEQSPQKPTPDTLLADTQTMAGFFDIHWQERTGKLYISIEDFDRSFLYLSWLARGVGSNDIGLDRGQPGNSRVVHFVRVGPQVLLVQENSNFVAAGSDVVALAAVRESFAVSVLGSFAVMAEDEASVVVDITDFFLRDSHKLATKLEELKEGSYNADRELSAVYLPKTASFPDNTEIEALVTFVGKPEGKQLPQVVPDPTHLTVHMHHSLVQLPDDNFVGIPYEPRAGYMDPAWYGQFQDYAVPLNQRLHKAWLPRHRLRKRDPSAQLSEPLEPIIYYLDAAVPEPARSALLEGARWWDQAFAAAGYQNAFQVKLLPADADPMDVRYNTIQWVHRSTRGWSYGSPVVDPRSGEIIKGHVTLGSLRVRQDYLLAEGLLAAYAADQQSAAMEEFALARLRQLAAHEVGHTLGLAHNFAGSVDNRASVMDYPHPWITLTADGQVDVSNAYGVGIGAWDKRAILYGYQDFQDSTQAAQQRAKILAETLASGLHFVGDRESRGVATGHPLGSLWDNGDNAIDELNRLVAVRSVVLGNFSEQVIRDGRAMATLEEVLVPMYLLHRYQLQAAGKFIGGQYFSYAHRGDGQLITKAVAAAEQWRAVDSILQTLDADFLALSPQLVSLIPPRPAGYPPTAELFVRKTGDMFDPIAAAEASSALALEVLLNPQRAARMNRLSILNPQQPAFSAVVMRLLDKTWRVKTAAASLVGIRRAIDTQVLVSLAGLVRDAEVTAQVRATALDALLELDNWLERQTPDGPDQRAHYRFARLQIAQLQNTVEGFAAPLPAKAPPGSPI